MSVSADEAIISFPIRLVGEEGEDATSNDSTGLEGLATEDIDAITDFVKTVDKEGMKRLTKFINNPQAAATGELFGLLSKAALPAAIVAAIIQSPEILRTIVKALAVKGGPLNQDFHRFFEDEAQLGFDRELQYRRAVGLDVVITSDNRGFILEDPGFVGNNLVDVDRTRSIRNSTNQNVYGYVDGM